jgi:S1-C subfamily serine protease
MPQGIVSALGRSISAVTGFSTPEAIRIDAAINPGKQSHKISFNAARAAK